MGERLVEDPEKNKKSRLDDYTRKLYEKYGFDENSTGEEIEPKVLELLSDVKTSMDGAELILGRRVDAKETEIGEIIYMPTEAKNKFGLLLFKKGAEEMNQNK